MDNWQDYAKLAAELIGFITVVATLLAKITPEKSEVVFSILKLLPTFGVNPNTKALERALITYKEKEKADKGQDNNA